MFTQERTESVLRRLAAQFFQNISSASLLTVTSCRLSSDGKRATIFVSVLPEEEGPATYEYAKRRLSEFQEYVREHVRIHSVPFFEISLAKEGEK